MHKKNPINLDLFTIKFPFTAITSIVHRISGVVLFLCLPLMYWMLGKSLKSSQDFDFLMGLLHHSIWFSALFWLMVNAMAYHILAGLRHLMMDFGFGETQKTAKTSAIIMVILFVVVMVWTGVLIW